MVTWCVVEFLLVVFAFHLEICFVFFEQKKISFKFFFFSKQIKIAFTHFLRLICRFLSSSSMFFSSMLVSWHVSDGSYWPYFLCWMPRLTSFDWSWKLLRFVELFDVERRCLRLLVLSKSSLFCSITSFFFSLSESLSGLFGWFNSQLLRRLRLLLTF